MKIINLNSFGREKWDQLIEQLPDENIFMYSYYLDATTDHWNILVDDDGQAILPLPEFPKWNIKRILMPQFTRAFQWLKSDVDENEVVSFLKKHYHQCKLVIHSKEESPKTYQVLNIEDYQPRENTRRMVKKASKNGLEVKTLGHFNEIFNIFKSTTLNKIETLQEKDLQYLHRLFKKLKMTENGLFKGVYLNGKLLGGAVYMQNKDRLFYLKGAVEDDCKKIGGMYFLMDTVIKESQGEFKIFDFGGSSIAGVANFNRKFGTKDEFCSFLEFDQRPKWFKWLRNWKHKEQK